MRIQHLQTHEGSLSPEEAAEGIRLALDNAARLVADAELLFVAKRFASACSLATLALEECSKPEVLRKILLTSNPEELATHWEEFRQGRIQDSESLFQELIKQRILKGLTHRNRDSELRRNLREAHEVTEYLREWRSSAERTICEGGVQWNHPGERVDAEVAAAFLDAARAVLNHALERPMRSSAELRIWAEHLRPVSGQSMNAMRAAWLEAFEEAKRQGVLEGRFGTQEIDEVFRLFPPEQAD